MFNIGQDEVSRIINGRRWYEVAHLYQVVLAGATRRVNVSADTAEEAQAKVTPAEGETIVEVVDGGELVA